MARTIITVPEVVRAGLEVQAFVACNFPDGMKFYGNEGGDIEIEVENAGGSDQTVTVLANPDLQTDDLTVNDLVLTVPYGKTYKFGPFRPNTFKQVADGSAIYLDFSTGTTFTIRATKRQSARV